MVIATPGFTGSRLDRLENEREDPEAYTRYLADPDALFLPLDGLDVEIDAEGRMPWVPLQGRTTSHYLALLGLLDGKPCFVELAPVQGDSANARSIFHLLGLMAEGEASTYAAARSLVDWHSRHRFCARCGSATVEFRVGWGRRCESCNTEHYPRTDPVVIMLAEYQDKVLVGRQHRFPPRFYSALAGFIEVGEGIEEAVRRELFEESGLRTTDVRYISSQPWPFPSSLMIACIAKACDNKVTLDEKELEDAFWVSRDDVLLAMSGDESARFTMPPDFAIAHTLLKAWADGH